MDWIQFFTFLIVNTAFTLTLWLWNRSEANADRRDICQLIKAIQEDVRSVHEEIKDFHGRLCAIEERNRGK